MRFRTHLAFGVFVSVAFASLTQISDKWIFSLGLLLGSVLPDLDLQTSWIGRRVRPVSWLFNTLLGHRGILHSIWALIPIAALCWVSMPMLAIGFVTGFISHLLIDSTTTKGIRWLWPFVRIRGPIATGGFEDTLLFLFFATASIVGIITQMV
jgi:inner membrane protein